MTDSGNRIVLDLKYTANQRSETVRQVYFDGIRMRESDNSSIISLRQPEGNGHFAIEIGAIEWIRINGKTRKLKSPGTQGKLREAELKFLLQGKKREDWTDPFLRGYDHEDLIAASQSDRGFFGWIIGILGFMFLSLPGFAGLAVAILIGYMAWTMFHHMR